MTGTDTSVFDLPQPYRSKINHFRTNQGQCASCHKKWGIANKWQGSGQCGKRQAMLHVVNSCPQTKLEGGLPQFHLAEDAAVQCMMSHTWLVMHTITTTTTTTDTSVRYNKHNILQTLTLLTKILTSK